MKKCLLFSLLFYSNFTFGQLNDSFTDGDFMGTPVWQGNTAGFMINGSNQLQTTTSTLAQTVYLSTSNSLASNVKWEFYVQLNFDPSTNNQVRIYLVSDNMDLTSSLNGYFLQVGESGSSDSYDLYRQNGATITKIIDGPAKTRGSNTLLKTQVIVTRDGSGNWELQTAIDGSPTFVTEGTITDNTFTNTSYFGVSCKYTTSNSGKFIFDDFKIESTTPMDTAPPRLISITAVDTLTLEALFNEPVESISAQTLSNYSLTNGYDNPTQIITTTDPAKYRLKYSSSLVTGSYTLTVANVKDLNNNVIAGNNTASLNYTKPYLAKKGDLIINEIFADPTPQIDLPSVEFIEILNTSAHTLRLQNWKYKDATTTVSLPADSILSGELLILCAKADTNEYKVYGRTIGISPWPSLNNSGDILKLISPENLTIDSIAYQDTWYKDAAKKSGGYSLERINPSNTCSGFYNWAAGKDLTGGTPGRINSIYKPTPALTLKIDSIKTTSDSTLYIVLNAIPDTSFIKSSYFKINAFSATKAAFSSDFSRINLTFKTRFSEGTTYELIADSIRTCAGIIIANPNNNISFTMPVIPEINYPIIINEIFADPTPVIGLPEVEFIELFNPTTQTVQLKGLSYEDATGTIFTLSSGEIQANDYLILCSLKDTAYYKPLGKTLGISPWPSLNNDQDVLILRNNKGREIHRVAYSSSWYKNAEKQPGGYSLELINPQATCSGIQNWSASKDPSGGTPGRKNSVFENSVTSPLELSLASLTDSITLTLSFNKYVDSLSAAVPGNYVVNNGLGNPVKALPKGPDFQQVDLMFLSVSRGKTYKITVSDLTDCSGGLISATKNSMNFVYPEKIQKGDILINEILFNPRSDGADFVEIYNATDHPLDLKELSLASTNEKDSLISIKPLSLTQLLFEPKAYLVLTSDPEKIKQAYQTQNPSAFLKLVSLPSFNDDKGVAVLLAGNNRIDQLNYSEKMHFPLIKDPEGVSLERSSFKNPTNEPGNFRSAAATMGYATPGYKNSQYVENEVNNEEIYLASNTFSPDNDGFEDVLILNYHLAQSGIVANVSVYNDQGILIRKINKNTTLATGGAFIWDGLTEQNEKAPIGIYVVYVELFGLNGQIKKYRKNFVLAGKLN